jgi:AGZA family xanthine/uracil permease-like MFS transporter
VASDEPAPEPSRLDRFFRVSERGSNVRVEVLGGVTTFATMAYIIVVNPAILEHAGIPAGPCTVATILTAVFGTLLMALYANRPLAVAPYMGENAFIAFGLMGLAVAVTPQQRLGTVAFLILTLLKLRTWLANSISLSMKHSFGVGIGLFLMFLGMYKTGIVTSFVTGMPYQALLVPDGQLLRTPDVPVKIGHFGDPKVQLAIGGFVLITILMIRKVRGAILIGIAATAIGGYVLGVGKAPEGVFALPFTGKYDLSQIAFTLDVQGVLNLTFLPVLLTLFLVSFLDTLGTLIGVAAAGDMLDEHGNLPEVERPMLIDALSSIFSALVGTSTSGAYIESAAGVREGARTGLASLVTAGLFALTLFIIPLLEPLQQLDYAYGPALIAVGVLMFGSVTKIDFNDWTELVPCLAAIALMLFSFNIGNGLTAGLILHPIMKIGVGRWGEVTGGGLVLAALCLVYYVFGLPH